MSVIILKPFDLEWHRCWFLCVTGVSNWDSALTQFYLSWCLQQGGIEERGGTFKLPPRPDFSHRLLTQVSNTRWQVIAVAAFACYNHIGNNHQSRNHDLRRRALSTNEVLTWWCENFIALLFHDCKILRCCYWIWKTNMTLNQPLKRICTTFV